MSVILCNIIDIESVFLSRTIKGEQDGGVSRRGEGGEEDEERAEEGAEKWLVQLGKTCFPELYEPSLKKEKKELRKEKKEKKEKTWERRE